MFFRLFSKNPSYSDHVKGKTSWKFNSYGYAEEKKGDIVTKLNDAFEIAKNDYGIDAVFVPPRCQSIFRVIKSHDFPPVLFQQQISQIFAGHSLFTNYKKYA